MSIGINFTISSHTLLIGLEGERGIAVIKLSVLNFISMVLYVVYNQSVEVGFTESRVNIARGSSHNIYVQIFDLRSEDIDSRRPLSLELLTLPSGDGKLGCIIKLELSKAHTPPPPPTHTQ